MEMIFSFKFRRRHKKVLEYGNKAQKTIITLKMFWGTTFMQVFFFFKKNYYINLKKVKIVDDTHVSSASTDKTMLTM